MRPLAKRFPGLSARINDLYRGFRLYRANRSPRAWGVLAAHLWRRMLTRSVPPFITIAVTYRCPCRCVHCYASAPDRSGPDELDTAQMKSVIDQAKRLGVIGIIFSGGDPLMRPDIVELVRHAHALGLLTRVSTTGLTLDSKLVSELKAAGLTQCGVSIDHPDPEVHDQLRGVPGAHEKAIEAIRNLRQADILCQILVYASKRNVPSGLERIVELGRSLDVFAVYIFFTMAVGRWDGAFDQVLSDQERAAVRELADLKFVHVELPTPRTRCAVITKSIVYVTPQGDVTPCPFVPYVLGNLRDKTLGELWRGHCKALTIDYRGECPMNDIHCREALKQHVESVARSLR